MTQRNKMLHNEIIFEFALKHIYNFPNFFPLASPIEKLRFYVTKTLCPTKNPSNPCHRETLGIVNSHIINRNISSSFAHSHIVNETAKSPFYSLKKWSKNWPYWNQRKRTTNASELSYTRLGFNGVETREAWNLSVRSMFRLFAPRTWTARMSRLRTLIRFNPAR